MPTFQYSALTSEGAAVTGRQRARTMSDARFLLKEQELTVTSLTARKSLLAVEVTPPRIKPNDLMHLSQQLSAFIRAGIPILDAMTELSEGSDSRGVRRVLDEIIADLRAGATLTEAFDRHPEDFPTYYRGILRSAELTGQLDTVLDQLAVYLERDLEARRKLKSAMVYPAIVAVMAIGTVVVLTAFVLPKFKTFFASLDAELPAPTRLLLSVSDFVQQWGWLIALVAALSVVAYFIGVRTRRGRHLRDRTFLKLPVLGSTIESSTTERFTRILSSMVGAGVPLPEAMQVATSSLNNLAFEYPLVRARSQMIDGAGLSGPIASTKKFPRMAVQMIRVGEDTGTLDRQLEVAAEFYSRDLDHKVKRLATLVEPAVILIMGSIVGFVAIALVSAMYGIFRATNLT